ncbi:MAG: YolD-like family protein [Acholeplasmataceae bacterium]|nr:YolD-like family protein [Acholeplasmataceae bacterium]
MPETYVDRGIIKWNPFDALAGYGTMLEEMRRRRGKRDQPILSEDALAQMNIVLSDAFQQQRTVHVSYFKNGYVLNTYGTIIKIDWIRKTITLSTAERIIADDITAIDLDG